MDNISCIEIYDSVEFRAVTGIRSILSFISFFSILFIIALIVLFKKYAFFIQRLILYLCIGAATNAFVGGINVVGTIAHRNPSLAAYCVFIGFLDEYTGWWVLMAETIITIDVFIRVMLFKNTRRVEVLYVFLIFGFPILINWIPFTQSAYGGGGPWCWIRYTNDDCSRFIFGMAMQFVIWYIPLYFLMAILTVLIVIVLVTLHRRKSRWTGAFNPIASGAQERMQKEAQPLIAYPIIFIVLNLILLINRIYNVANPGRPNVVLWFISAFSYPLQGAIITMAYTLDPETRKKVRITELRAAAKTFSHSNMITEYPIEYSGLEM